MKLINLYCFLLLAIVAACSTLKLQPADFAWPVESVINIDENGKASDERYSISFDTKALFYEELEDSSSYIGKEIRILRDTRGYYFITAEKFNNVYVFKMDDGAMSLQNKIFISEPGIENPALNQRSPFIELITGGNSMYLTIKGIERITK